MSTKYIVVCDIDNTLLDTLGYIKQHDETFSDYTGSYPFNTANPKERQWLNHFNHADTYTHAKVNNEVFDLLKTLVIHHKTTLHLVFISTCLSPYIEVQKLLRLYKICDLLGIDDQQFDFYTKSEDISYAIKNAHTIIDDAPERILSMQQNHNTKKYIVEYPYNKHLQSPNAVILAPNTLF